MPNLENLLASTFIGGIQSDRANAIALDSNNNIFVTGETSSTDFPTSPNAYDTTHNGGQEVFVSKLDNTLQSLLSSTLIAGDVESDAGNAIALDSSGNVYVTGSTNSPHFPVTPGAYDTTYNNSEEGFVLKLDNSLQNLLASTFLGGSDYDIAYSIALNASGNVYVVGRTPSSDFPTVDGSYDTTYNGDDDAFVVKFDNELSSEAVSTTTTTDQDQPCPSEKIYGGHSEEIEILRYFRDNVLRQTSEGQELIRLYYQWSPAIVKMMEEDEEFKEGAKEIIDEILPLMRKEVE